MKDFIKVQKINQKAQILVNKKFITRIIEGKQDSCIVFKRNKVNDKLIVKQYNCNIRYKERCFFTNTIELA